MFKKMDGMAVSLGALAVACVAGLTLAVHWLLATVLYTTAAVMLIVGGLAIRTQSKDTPEE